MKALLFLSCAWSLTAQNYTISTVAGGGLLPNGPNASNLAIGNPFSIAADRSGNLFVGIGYGVIKVDPTGAVTPFAGMGTPGDTGDGGPATKAQISIALALAVDPAGNLYIAEGGAGLVRKVGTDGNISTIAGTGPNCCYNNGNGDGGPATSATLFYPYQVAADASGNVFIGEWNTARIRRISTDGTILTIAGTGVGGFSGDGGPANQAQIGAPWGLAVDSAGNLWFSDDQPGDDILPVQTHVRKITPDGMITTVAGTGVPGYSGDGGPALSAQLFAPGQLTVDDSGNVYFPDQQNIRMISANGIITTIAGNGKYGYSGDGGPALAAAFSYSDYGQGMGVAVDPSGNVYVADTGNFRVRKISNQLVASAIGNGGGCCYAGATEPALSAQLNNPAGVAVDSNGNVYISDTYNGFVRKVTSDGVIHTIGGAGPQGSLASGVPAAQELLSFPTGMVVGPNGSLYFADTFTNRILSISSVDGTIATVAGMAGQNGFSGDGGSATSANLNFPKDVAFDTSGSLYIADAANHAIRKVDGNGRISTIAGNGTVGFTGDGGPALSATFYQPSGIAVDRNGNIYIADTLNFRIRKIDPSGTITTIAGTGFIAFAGDGGPASSASLFYPTEVRVDGNGAVYIADYAAVRKITPDGIINTIGGTGVSGYTGDGGPATSAQVSVWGLGIDAAGDVYIAAPVDNAVRVLRPAQK